MIERDLLTAISREPESMQQELGGFDPLSLATQAMMKLKQVGRDTYVHVADGITLGTISLNALVEADVIDFSVVAHTELVDKVAAPIIPSGETEEIVELARHRPNRAMLKPHPLRQATILERVGAPKDTDREHALLMNDVRRCINLLGLDKQQFGKAKSDTDKLAVFCKQYLSCDRQPSSMDITLDRALKQIEAFCVKATNKMVDHYYANGRVDKDDFRQAIREHLITSILAQYDPESSSFRNYYAQTGWRRLEYFVRQNLSQLSIRKRVKDYSEDERSKILGSGSYHDAGFMRAAAIEQDDHNGEEYVGASPDLSQLDQLIVKEKLGAIVATVNERLSGLEDEAFKLVRLKELSYTEAAEILGLDEKQIDNALQRAEKKLKAALVASGYAD